MQIRTDFDGIQFMTTITDGGASVTLRGCPRPGVGTDTPAAAAARGAVSAAGGVTICVEGLDLPALFRPELSPHDLAGIDAACREIADTLHLTGDEVISVVPVTRHSEGLIGPRQRFLPTVGVTHQWDDVTRAQRVRNAAGEESSVDLGGVDYTAALD